MDMQDMRLAVSRRSVVVGLGGVLLAGLMPVSLLAEAKPRITVYKSPSCGCCQGWVDHLVKDGFEAQVIERDDLTGIKRQYGVPQQLQSCHTAEVRGYVVEGHVPAAAIRKLLAEKPKATGLAVPGMPIGSPGMEGGRPETYAVMLFDASSERVYGRYIESRELATP